MTDGRTRAPLRPAEQPGLDADLKVALLGWARATLEAALQGRAAPEAPGDEALRRPGGAFVSLHSREGELRGCVGLLRADGPLTETVARMVVAAAQDARFSRVRAHELTALRIEISVLGPVERIHPEEIMVGRDGLVLRCRERSGVLLPQVATQNGWGREEFLRRTAEKAGLPESAWEDTEAEVFAFVAEVFGED